MDIVAHNLRFPEGPVWRDDTTVLVTEIASGCLTSVDVTTGATTVLASSLPGPNGAALVPSGSTPTAIPAGHDGTGGAGALTRVWVADNGGFFTWHEVSGLIIPGEPSPAHTGGSLRMVTLGADPADRSGDVVHTRCGAGDGAGDGDGDGGDTALVSPNDLVVDADAGVWFTDFGVQDGTAGAGRPGVVFAPGGGGPLVGVVWGTHQANGIGLSADGSELYVAETHSASLWRFSVTGPGQVANGGAPGQVHGGTLLHRAGGFMFDSLAVDPDGWVCVATIGPGGGVTCVHPVTGAVRRVTAPDDLTTNVCFGSPAGLPVAAFVTLSSTGQLGHIADWRAARG
jgi:gluconolactonase